MTQAQQERGCGLHGLIHCTQCAARAVLVRLRAENEQLRAQLYRRPALNVGLDAAYAAWNTECYQVLGAMTMASANGARLAAQAQERRPLTDEQIASACFSFRRDFRRFDHANKAQLMDDARRWERAFAVEHGRSIEPAP